MVVRLDFDQRVQDFVSELPSAGGVVRGPEIGNFSLQNSGIVAIRGYGEIRDLLVGVLDHLEKTLAHRLAVDSPGCIEDFVPTMPIGDERSQNLNWEKPRKLDTRLLRAI